MLRRHSWQEYSRCALFYQLQSSLHTGGSIAGRGWPVKTGSRRSRALRRRTSMPHRPGLAPGQSAGTIPPPGQETAIAIGLRVGASNMTTRGNENGATVTVYTDGGCIGNPGPGGWAAILIYGEREKELTGRSSKTTNNRMEMRA
ncbi:MAG: hypothetical protein KDD75_09230, partial [Caldilineaceae bacterium]|nr:hypothetical protein [Caldilineaceae bacterium]